MRDDGRIRFAKEIRERVDGLRDAVRSVKGELLGKGSSKLAMSALSADLVNRRTHARVCHNQAYAQHSRLACKLQSGH